MECIVTGAAGFIGSHLCQRLLDDGHRVTGIDCFTPYYPRTVKERNLYPVRERERFTFVEVDLSRGDLDNCLRGAEWIFHLAAMPGLVKSWTHFDQYNTHNIIATHRLLEAAKNLPNLSRFVYASTSSVYGRFASGDESLPTRPSSPYGVTKLACENLCRIYGDEFDIPAVILRYFSVYGPKQRPDMGYHQFIEAVLAGRPIILTGDGTQVTEATPTFPIVSKPRSRPRIRFAAKRSTSAAANWYRSATSFGKSNESRAKLPESNKRSSARETSAIRGPTSTN